MRDGNVPRFFCVAKRGRADPAGGVARGTSLRNPAFQLAAVPAFHDIAGAGRKGRETGREDRKRGGGRKKVEEMEEDGKLLVEQIKTKTARSRAALYYIIVPQFALPFQRPEESH